jgi:ATP-dependent RNA helicase DDX51/DBP6
MDHLTSTPNFTLQHLRFLVIDEADRLLNQSFQNWLAQVIAHIQPPLNPTPPSTFEPDDFLAQAWMEAYGLSKRHPELRDLDQVTVSRRGSSS